MSTSCFCSNPDALGVGESAKGIFDSLKNIGQLPPSSPKEGDQLGDYVDGTAKNQSIGEADRSPAVSAGES